MSRYRSMARCLGSPIICRTGRYLVRNNAGVLRVSTERVSRRLSSVCISPSQPLSQAVTGLSCLSLKLASFSGIPRVHLAGLCSRGSDHEVSYEEMVELVQDRRNLLVDVREPSEREYFGHISDNSINIPLGELYSAFSLPKEDFEARYNFEKPEKDSPNVILYCGSGVRSAVARDIVQSTGYTKARDYAGGWIDWAEKGKRAS